MNKRFEALDAFRGLCAISVVVFHLDLVESITELDFFKGSSIFVEFFFVLSGFVLAHGYGFKKSLNFKTFMKARFYRLYPLHFFMLLVMIVIELSKLFAYEYGGFVFTNVPFTNSFALSEIIPNLLLIQSWTPLTHSGSFNSPAWSISMEFYMYALLFVSIVVFKSNRVIAWFAISLIVFILMFLGSDILVNTVYRGLSCFFGGAFTYVMYKKLSHLKPSYILGSVVEAVLILCVVMIVQSKSEYRPIFAPLVFFITVLFFAFESGAIAKSLKIKPMQYAGTLSYSIYMTHFAIIFCLISIAMVLQKITGNEIALIIEGKRYLNFGGSIMNNLAVFVIIAIVVYISSLTYKYVEIKGLDLNKK
jgi:peptidoglycan/LPS O-acetylase OafA/YrhL